VLPFCHFEIRATRPRSSQYPKQINTIGEHIRARRLDLNLLQRQVADQIGVHPLTVTNWESNESSPETQFIPAIIEFLGYDPLPPASSLPERLASRRKVLGLSQRKMAERMCVDPGRAWMGSKGRFRFPREGSRMFVNLSIVAGNAIDHA